MIILTQVASVRNGVMATLSGPLALAGLINSRKRRRRKDEDVKSMAPWQRWLLLLRVAVMNVALSIMFYSFRHMPLGETVKYRLYVYGYKVCTSIHRLYIVLKLSHMREGANC